MIKLKLKKNKTLLKVIIVCEMEQSKNTTYFNILLIINVYDHKF